MTASGAETAIGAIRQQLAAIEVERQRLEARLRQLEQPRLAPVPAAPSKAPVTNGSPASEKVALFRRLFGGRTDVFPARWENREQLDYGGLRLSGSATIGGAVVRLVVDIGFGDALEPGVMDIAYPVLLDFPVPRLRAYAPETVVAEKFQAMVALGRINSRMKDLYDIWVLARTFPFTDDRLPRRGGGVDPSEPPFRKFALAASPAWYTVCLSGMPYASLRRRS